jgi:hypothetical protein
LLSTISGSAAAGAVTDPVDVGLVVAEGAVLLVDGVLVDPVVLAGVVLDDLLAEEPVPVDPVGVGLADAEFRVEALACPALWPLGWRSAVMVSAPATIAATTSATPTPTSSRRREGCGGGALWAMGQKRKESDVDAEASG